MAAPNPPLLSVEPKDGRARVAVLEQDGAPGLIRDYSSPGAGSSSAP